MWLCTNPRKEKEIEDNTMANVQTVRLKPNPSGKDRTRRGGATATQLGGEWADIQNVSAKPVNMDNVTLEHVAYNADGRASRWEQVMSFKGILRPKQVVRIHAGSGPESVLLPVDKNGADIHLFTGGNYVWNNDKSDCASLFASGQPQPFDKACYAANPPEGVVLKRGGDSLVSVTSTTTASARR